MLFKYIFSCRVSHVFKLHILPLLVKPSPLCLKSTVFIHVYQLFWCKSTFGRLTPLWWTTGFVDTHGKPTVPHVTTSWSCRLIHPTAWFKTGDHFLHSVLRLVRFSDTRFAWCFFLAGTVGRWKGVLGTDIDKAQAKSGTIMESQKWNSAQVNPTKRLRGLEADQPTIGHALLRNLRGLDVCVVVTFRVRFDAWWSFEFGIWWFAWWFQTWLLLSIMSNIWETLNYMVQMYSYYSYLIISFLSYLIIPICSMVLEYLPTFTP